MNNAVVGDAPFETIRVASASSPSAVAGAIAGCVREGKRNLAVQAVGAGAVNVGVKAVAIANAYLVEDGFHLVVDPVFVDVVIKEETRTAIRMTLLITRLEQEAI